MKTKTIITLIAVFVALISIFGVAYIKGRATAFSQMLDEQLVALKTSIERLEGRTASLWETVKKQNEEKLRIQALLDRTLEAREKDRQEFEQRLLEAKTVSTPNQLVIETQRILKTEEVTWNWRVAEFPLPAFRTNTLKLLDWENFTLIREPSYKLEIGDQAKFIVIQTKQIMTQGLVIDVKDKMINTYSESLKDIERYFGAKEKGRFLDSTFKVMGGVAVGLLLSMFLVGK